MNKYILTLVAAATAISCATAQTPPHISVVTTTSDNPHHFMIDDLEKLTFEGQEMIVHHADGTTRFNVADIDRLAFDLEMTAIDEIKTDLSDEIQITSSAGILTITALESTPIHVQVYDINGRLIDNTVANTTVSIDFNTKAAGVYIIRANNKTIKYKK